MSYLIKGEDGKPILRNGKEVAAMDFGGTVKGVDYEKRLLTIIGSDETVDRDGDIISVKGWMLENYLKNPVFLWAHNYSSVPLGSAVKVTKKKDPLSLQFTIKFPTVGLNPFADMIFSLYGERIINASSVGFIPWEWEEMTESEKEGLSPLAQCWGGRRFTKQELLELSGCAVPSNPSALQNALKSLVTGEDITSVYMPFLLGQKSSIEDMIAVDLVKSELLSMADFEDETESKIHQVPKEFEGAEAMSIPEEKTEVESEIAVGSNNPTHELLVLSIPRSILEKITEWTLSDGFEAKLHIVPGEENGNFEVRGVSYEVTPTRETLTEEERCWCDLFDSFDDLSVDMRDWQVGEQKTITFTRHEKEIKAEIVGSGFVPKTAVDNKVWDMLNQAKRLLNEALSNTQKGESELPLTEQSGEVNPNTLKELEEEVGKLSQTIKCLVGGM
jgi:hypothetical protein